MKANDSERAALMRDINFRWLIGGGITSMLGDQFTLVALPWHSGGGEAKGDIPDAFGLGCAFPIDAFTFAFGIWTLSKVRVRCTPPPAWPRPHVLNSVYWGAIAFFIHGPIQVGIPVLSHQLSDCAGGYGALLGAHGAGTLTGLVIAGLLPNVRAGRLGATILMADAIVSLLFMPMGLVGATWQGAVLMLLIGSLGGFLQVAVYTWLQRRVPPQMLGRTMSLFMFMFIFMGVGPVSAAIAGWVMRSVTTAQLFMGSRATLLLIVCVALVATPMRTIIDSERLPHAG